MLAVTPLRNSTTGDRAGDVGGSTNLQTSDDFSVEFDFDFSELFAGFDDTESLSGLEIDAVNLQSPETSAAELETSSGRDAEQEEGEEETVLTSCEEVLRSEVKEETSAASEMSSPATAPEKEKERGRKSSAGKAKRFNGKRKVDWTAELHRRFVQVVEQLGEEQAVPSRILELMGIDCLTRHNVASHLQKYRSHRKHMMARDAEATGSKQRRQVYAANCWPLAMGFAPNAPPLHPHRLHPHPHVQHFRPLHVWGHPTGNQSLVHMWPKHLIPLGPSPSLPWPVAPPHPVQPLQLPPHGSPWSPHFAVGTMTQGAPYFSQPSPTLSKESIDAALGDALAQPWLPLPLGLKPPSLESVMVELHKQGISNVPPSN